MNKFQDLPIGIDLGTTFSCIGVYKNSTVEIIPNEKDERTTPSVVSFQDDDIYVGEQTEYKRLENKKNKIYSIKRIIGRNFFEKDVQEDINNFTYKVINKNGNPLIEINSNGRKEYSPEEISAKVLSKLKQSAEDFLKTEIKKVVITVPAYFTEGQKQATKNAGEIAGLNVIKIINEPTAAALAYGFGKCCNHNKFKLFRKNSFNNENQDFYIDLKNNKNDNDKKCKKIIVFDLGGGTLDVTLLELENDDITIKAHNGVMHLGGEDFDNKLVEYCIEKFKKKFTIDLNNNEFEIQKYRIKEHCEKAKKELSYQIETEIDIESLAKGKDLLLKITRVKFEKLCKDLFDNCKKAVTEILENSKENKNNIDEILLVGGSTRIPKIQSILAEIFDENKINKSLNPDEAVAYGATIEAAMEMGLYAKDVTLLDVCPFSLGVAETDEKTNKKNGCLMKKIINKGPKLPYKVVQRFNPVGEYPVLIKVYEGENTFVKDNYFLGSFYLYDIPNKKNNEINIDITFDLDENSILTVTGVIKENNCTNSIVIKKDKGGLSREEIEKAILKNKKEKFKKDIKLINLEKQCRYNVSELFKKINNSSNEIENLNLVQNSNNS